ncbi:sulfate transporter N-terminal domain with GLY motif-domain-containing protein [Entophlyctis helioformis]|nr:sulfate transporter N-terminal domain with GLY motif-domain-containing protein [Entophlyctis helioformis]
MSSSAKPDSSSATLGWISRLLGMVPVVGWLPSYSVRFLIDDLVGGFTLATLLIPQSMGYALMANLPPVYGLYTACIPPVVYFIFGTSPYGNMAPMAVTSLMVGDSVLAAAKWFAESRLPADTNSTATATMPASDSLPYIKYPDITTIAALQALLAGIFLLVLLITQSYRILNRLLSKSLIAGFTTAAAFAIMTSQVKNILGLRVAMPTGIGSSFMSWVVIFANISKMNWTAILLSIVSIAALMLIPTAEVAIRRRWRKWRTSRQNAMPDSEAVAAATPAAAACHTDLDSMDDLALDRIPTIDGVIIVEKARSVKAPRPIHSVFPVVLFVVAVLTAISALSNLPSKTGISVIGTIQSGLPGFSIPWRFDDLTASPKAAALHYPPPPNGDQLRSLLFFLLPSAISTALVSYVTSLSVIQTFPASPIIDPLASAPSQHDTKDEATVSSAKDSTEAAVDAAAQAASHAYAERQELFALGVSAAVSSFFSCFTGGIGLARAAVLANQTDNHSPFASLFSVGIVVLIISFVTKPFELVPTPVLSAVIIVAIIGLFRNVSEGWRLIVKARSDMACMVARTTTANDSAHEVAAHMFLSQGALGVLTVVTIWEDFVVWLITLLVTAFVDSAYGIFVGIGLVAVFRAVAYVADWRKPSETREPAIVHTTD